MGLLSGNGVHAVHLQSLSPALISCLSSMSNRVGLLEVPQILQNGHIWYLLGLDSAVSDRKSQNNSGLNR